MRDAVVSGLIALAAALSLCGVLLLGGVVMPLGRAFLCLDDDTVFDGTHAPRMCPRCAGRHVEPIARWLNRPPFPPKYILTLSPRELLALSQRGA